MLQIWDENVIFNAGAGLFALGLGTRILSLISRNILLVFRRKIVSSIEVNSLVKEIVLIDINLKCTESSSANEPQDPSYDWLLKFVRDHSSMNQIGIVTAKMKQDSIMNKPKFISQPEIGTHFFFYNKKLIKAERLRSQNHQFHTGKPFETLKIETMTKDVNFMPNLLHKSYNNFIEEHRSNSRTEIFTPRGIEWMKLGSDKKQRKMNSIFLDANLKKTLIEDFNQFINSQNWYNRCGIPYKRGYLFHGPPGCGKSSTIMAFAGEYNMNIGVINLSEIGLGDERLFYLLSIVPANTLIVMEDIDRILSGIDEKESQSPKFKGLNNLTYSGLLNALDGVASTNGLISFMTTNNYHKLDKTLIRPGRVDFNGYFGACDSKTARQMLYCFYQDILDSKIEDKEIEGYLKIFEDHRTRISHATLQALFLKYRNDPIGALKYLKSSCQGKEQQAEKI